jgi:hypothetical protein
VSLKRAFSFWREYESIIMEQTAEKIQIGNTDWMKPPPGWVETHYPGDNATDQEKALYTTEVIHRIYEIL